MSKPQDPAQRRGNKLRKLISTALFVHDVTQIELARALGVSDASVTHWLNHGVNPRAGKKYDEMIATLESLVAGASMPMKPVDEAPAGELTMVAPQEVHLEGREKAQWFAGGLAVGLMGSGLVAVAQALPL